MKDAIIRVLIKCYLLRIRTGKKKNLFVTNFDRQGCRGQWEIFSALLFPNQVINTIMETINIMNLQGLKNSLRKSVNK